MIRIITPSRLHITLIDLNASLGRVDGGIGLALSKPNIVLSGESADKIEVTGESDLAVERVLNSARLMADAYDVSASINVKQVYLDHVGLGSGTQIALATGMIINELHNLGLSVREIAEIVERGGTSGTGVAAFEHGGFILDGGHRFEDKGGFKPSSASKAPPPPVLLRVDFPNWDIIIALPELKGSHSAREVDIFQEKCPIPLEEVQKLSHLILMKTLPALLEKDVQGFGSSINEIQEIGFKKMEVELQHPVIRDVMSAMRDSGAQGAGMSSFGPVVYGITDASPENVRKAAQDILDGSVGGTTDIVSASNEGAEICRL